MATLLFSAIGTVVGGPVGGVLGALAGRQVQKAISPSSSREGARLQDLSLTTSSYGVAVPRLFGRMRVAGTIIWATDIVEHGDTQGGGKGTPSTTSYSYTASFAVALGSRPIQNVGRIWADGKLLRGAAGDLKTGGIFRFYPGHGDEQPDPLIAAAEGMDACPAWRGLAYCVFEDLQLGNFGNRLPALTFEVIADDLSGCPLSLAALTDGVLQGVDAAGSLDGIAGLAQPGALADLLAGLEPLFPFDCDVGADRLSLRSVGADAGAAIALGEPAGAAGPGISSRRLPPDPAPAMLRYYDIDRDYQPGVQHAIGRPAPGRETTLDLAATLGAADAARLIDGAARAASWGRRVLSWKSCEIDPAIMPGSIVSVPGESGLWRVHDWSWSAEGVALTLWRTALPVPISSVADAGRANISADLQGGASVLVAFELPWDGTGPDSPQLRAGVTSPASGWCGAALYLDQGDGNLQPLGVSVRDRAVIGIATTALSAASPLLFDRANGVIVSLVAPGAALGAATARQMASGANLALLGQELIQFAQAVPLGNGQWRLGGLLRGRGGTESAIATHVAGENFVLLGAGVVSLDGGITDFQAGANIAASGLCDPRPVQSAVACAGLTSRPLSPVHPICIRNADGGLTLGWTRRARGAWYWRDGVEVPLNEDAERYIVAFGRPDAPIAMWSCMQPQLQLSAAQLAPFADTAVPGAFTVRQQGTFALSDPLLLGSLG